MIKNKWKRFALRQVLSAWSGEVTEPADLYNRLAETPDSKLSTVFEEFDIVVWAPFENWTLADVTEQITTCAKSAQEADDEADE